MTQQDSAQSPADSHLVSVGVPVRNGAKTIETVISDLLSQTYAHIEIIISDNASTDGTDEICRRLAGSDQRISYHRQQVNVGPAANFRFVLAKARGSYFMWGAAGDRWQPAFVERNLERLASDSSLVASISRVAWMRDGVRDGLAAGTSPLMMTPKQNIRVYMRVARDNSRCYGLFERRVLANAFPAEDFYALDLAIMIGTLLVGNHAEVDEVLMTRTRTDPDSYIQYFEGGSGSWVRDQLPLADFTRYVIRELRIPLTATTAFMLFVRNVYEHVRHSARRDSMYGSLCRSALRLLSPAQRRITREARGTAS